MENFFDTYDSPLQDTVLTPEQYAEKLSRLASVIDSLDVDFLALEEVENIGCLKDLNRRLRHPYSQIGLLDGNDPRGINVAFMSRVPVRHLVSHRGQVLAAEEGVSGDYRFSRDCLEVKLATRPPLVLFVNHFKSQLGSKKKSAAKRHSQARAVVDIVNRIRHADDGVLPVIVGDLNDRPNSWALQPLRINFKDVLEGWGEPMRASHRSKQGRSSLDYIFIDKRAVPRLAEAKVWRDAGDGASDHDPISAKLFLDGSWTAPLETQVWTN